MSDEMSLSKVYTNEGVRAFGQALRFSLRDSQSPDFSTLVELEYVETKEGFADVITKFLRRYETQARRREQRNQPVFHPNQTHLEALIGMIDQAGVRPVRAALIAHALVYNDRKSSEAQSQIAEGVN